MTSAAVGFQCPECVAAGKAQQRQPMTRFGGRIDQGAVVTKSLIGVTIAVFVLQYVIGFNNSIEKYSLLGYALDDQGEAIGVAAGQYYRLFTAAFMHGGILHIVFNMWVLYLLGPQLESVLGRARFLTLYLVSALGGSAVSFLFSPPNAPSVGASGAIFGLMGATLVIGRAMRQDVASIVGFIGINLVLGFVLPNIDWRAHVGGLVVGAAVAAVFAFVPPLVAGKSAPVGAGSAVVAQQRTAQLIVWAGVVGIVVVLGVLVMYRVGQLTGF
jgi:membrane associated rhomboid family serine protease